LVPLAIKSPPLNYKNPTAQDALVNPLSSTIARRRMALLGHVLRRNVPLRDVIQWIPDSRYPARRGAGRTLADSLLRDVPAALREGLSNSTTIGRLTSRNVMWNSVIAKAQNRLSWNYQVVDVAAEEAARRFFN
jgi:hypothetical protein